MKMDSPEISRLSRLSAILIQIQTKRIVTATELAKKFQVSKRTIYRDLKALENAGVPIFTEEGKGYSLMEGYKLAPVMFSEKEANALILAEQLVLKNKDASFIKDYFQAIDKVKAILRYAEKDKAQILTQRTQYNEIKDLERNSANLSDIQYALTNHLVLNIDYQNKEEQASHRQIEPFALVSSENWYLIAYCRLRKEFRFFRLDRIQKLDLSNEKFEAHNMTLQEFFDKNQ